MWANGDEDAFARVDTEFHVAMVEAAHNNALLELYRGMAELVTSCVATTVRLEEKTPEPADHRNIVTAIAERDPERAARHAREFLDGLLTRHPAED